MADYVDQVLSEVSKICVAGWVEVLGEQHNVFLYLVEFKMQGMSLQHTAAQLTELYQLDYGRIND